MMLKLVLVWVLAALFLVNSLLVTLRSNLNTGTLLMWGVGALLLAYGVFHEPIDAFCAAGPGLVLKWLFWVGVAVFAALMVFLGLAGGRRSLRGDEAAIIVLGAGLRGSRVGDILRRRLDAALEAYRQNPAAPIVVTGGQGPQEDIPEAEAMGLWLEERGVDAACIIREDKSTSTETNLLYAKPLLAARGIGIGQPIVIVTNRFHCYRAGVYARRLGYTDVRLLPASMNLSTFLPNYMREVLALLYMWVFRKGARQS